MPKQNIEDFLKLLFDFNSDNDFKLDNDEYIRVKAIKPKDDEKPIIKTFFIKTVDEFMNIIKKYKYNYNLYVGIATTKGKHETEEYMNARKTLFFDFDKKDYPQFTELKDFTDHIKEILPYLFYHAIIDSGNGYHYYVATQRTVDTKRALQINRNLAKILGADLKAVLPTQIVRIPKSLNLKHDSKLVNTVCNNYGDKNFKPYTLSKLEKIVQDYKHVKLIKQVQRQAPKEFNKISSFYCIQKMISEGADKGERNFCLGRITKYLQTIKGYSYERALRFVQDWNKRCNPPKSAEEIESDFKRYWETDYKLLGCKIENEQSQSILNKFCDKFNCTTILKDSNTKIKSKEIMIDNHLLENNVLRRLRGNHYLILTVLHLHKDGLNKEQLKSEITNTRNKCYMSKNTLKSILNDLVTWKYISYDRYGTYKLIDIANYGKGFTRYYYSASVLLINGIITQQEYLVYICLVRNLQQNRNVSYETLSEDTLIDKYNVGKYIRNLFKSKILCLEKTYNEQGTLCNAYTLVA